MKKSAFILALLLATASLSGCIPPPGHHRGGTPIGPPIGPR
jgi:hypothetical protein